MKKNKSLKRHTKKEQSDIKEAINAVEAKRVMPQKTMFIVIGIIVIVFIVLLITQMNVFQKKEVTGEIQEPVILGCEGVEDYDRDDCYIELAVKINDVLICSLINDATFTDECYFRMANLLVKSSLCNNILQKNKMNICNAIVKRDASLCENVADNISKGGCYMNLAFFLNDISLCNKISVKSLSIICNAVILRNPKLCEEFKGIERDECFLAVAAASEDKSLCEKIKDEGYRESCYESMLFINQLKRV